MIFSNKVKSSVVNFSLLFNNKTTKLALSIKFILLFTPILSITSSVCLIPAVSVIFTIIPSRFIVPSTQSLVVPAMSVTIALSVSSKLFNKLLFPTLGRPIKARLIPSFTILPFSLFLRIHFISFSMSIIFIFRSCIVNSSISSYSG